MNIKFILIFSLFGFVFTSCEKDDEDLIDGASATEEVTETEENIDLEVEQFIYKGMNEIYLYKAEIPELEDSYFSTASAKNEFLESFGSPEDLFENLIYSQDRFSFLTDDYFALEDRFNGITSSNTAGMEYGLGRIQNTNNVFGFIRYVLPGTSAEEANLTRGTVFTEVNGEKMTLNNYEALLEENTISINIGEIKEGTLHMTEETVSLTKSEYTENPVYLAKTLDIQGKKVGYLMYNSFIADFDDELNAAFADFKAGGINDLILDLRYNGGGSVVSAVDLASMITGQFEGEIFMKEQWNEDYQASFEANDPEKLVNRFDSEIRTNEAINSLNLSKVYVLTTNSTASASELIINGLEPYIDVVQIGENTTGKFQASVTLYDSPNFAKKNANENHTYAIQPLVFKSANAEGKSDYIDGLHPDVEFSENLENLGILGDPSEPLLQAALNHLQGKSQAKKTAAQRKAAENFSTFGESGMNDIDYQRMYIEEIPILID